MDKDIVESKQADEQIESLARFPAENPSPVLRIATDGTLLYANDASQSLLEEWNCRVGQAVGEHWRERVSEAFESGSEKRVETEHAGRTFSFAIAPVVEAGYANIYGRDITERKESENALKLHELRLQSLLDLNKMVDSRQKEILDYVLEEMVKIIQSQFGFIALMSPDESVTTIYSWSKATMEECKVLEHPIHSPIDQAGWWGEAVRQRKPIIVNDYVSQSHPNKKGCPEGHTPLKRFLSLPVFDGEHIVAVVAVANKESDYDDSDVRALSNLTNDMWRMIRRKQDEEQIGNLAKFPSENPNPVLRIARDGTLLYANDASKSLLDEWNCQVGQVVGDWWAGKVAEAFESNSETRVETEHVGRTLAFAIAPVAEAGYANLYGRDITERKKAEEELRQGRQKYELAQKAANFGTWEWDIATGKTRWLGQFESLFGFSPGKLEQTFDVLIHLIHPEDRKKVIDGAEACVKKKGPCNVEYRITRPDGAVRWILGTSDIMQNPDGRPSSMYGIVQDITERKEAEEELLRYASIVSSSSDMMAILDSNFIYLATNEAYLAAFGMTRDEVVGHTVSEVFGEEFFETIIRPNAERCLEGDKVLYDNWFQFPVPGSRYMLVNYSPYIGQDGEQKGFVINAKDITERKQAEERIENLAKFPSENPNPVLRIAKDGTLLYANEASESLLHEWSCQVGQGVGECWRQWVAGAFDLGSEKRVETEHAGRTYSFAIAPVAEAGYANIYGRDITHRKLVEKEREQLLKTVAAKNQELQDIIYIASHDLKTPLVNILGFSGELLKDLEQLESLLRKDAHEPSEKSAIENLVHNDIPQEVKFISSGGRMLKGLIDGMLQVSRIGSAEYTIERMNMNELVKEVVDGLEFSIRDGGVSVSVEELPDCLGDAPKTSQIFGNLINNALKYLDPGRKGVVRIRGRCENGRSEYCVEDNGLGIDADHQAKVFEIFHRLNPSDDIGGEGLGLTIAVRILDQMEGTIRLESEPGKGSRFFVSLPNA